MGIFSWLFFWRKPKLHPGYAEDGPDFRDLIFSSQFGHVNHDGHADLRGSMPPVVDQGNIGACVPCAMVALLSYLNFKDRMDDVREELNNLPPEAGYLIADDGAILWSMGSQKTGETVTTTANQIKFSPLFLYYAIRERTGNTDEDSGAQIRDAFKVVVASGTCYEDTWPYKENRYAWKPYRQAYKEAEILRPRKKYWRLINLDDVRSCLDDGFPVLLGMSIYDNWEEAKRTAFLGAPAANAARRGGHCVLVVGYDDEKSVVTCRNSMGASWGDGGYFEMSYDYLRKYGPIEDMWTMR